MLLAQLDDLSTRIDQVTALLEAAITALTPPPAGTDTPTGDGDGDVDGDGATGPPWNGPCTGGSPSITPGWPGCCSASSTS